MAGEIDPYDSAFADLIRTENKGAEPAPAKPPEPASAPAPAAEGATPPATPPAPAPAAPDPAAPAATGDEPATEIEGADDTGGEPAPPAAPPAPPAPPADADALSRLADMLAQRQQPPAPPAPASAPPPQPAFNADDQAFLNQYIADFPDVARAESLFRQAEYRVLTAHIFREVNAYFAPRMALLDQLADGVAYNQLAQKVPNYDTTRERVVEWVKTQPAYLQTAYNHVIAGGTVEEISDLFDRFAQATATPPPAKPAAELSPAAKQAVARLAPVNGKRTAPTQGAPQTFDAAFEAFAKEA